MLCKTATLASLLMPGWRPTAVGFQDSDTHPIRCNYSLEEDAGRCDIVLAAVEQAWEKQVTQIGFPAPIPDEDGLLDIYLHEDPDGGAYAWCGTYGDDDPDDGRSGCAAIIAIDRQIPDKILPWYLAHEFNHALQWATDFNEATTAVWEGTATAAEPWTDASAFKVDLSYLEDFQATPWLGILGDGTFLWDEHQLWSYYEYGAALWVLHLDHAYGDGAGSGGRDLWLALAQEGLPNSPDVIDGYDTLSGDWRAALMDFSLERTRVGTEHAPEWADFPVGRVTLSPDAVVAWPAGDLVPATQPYETGAVYWVLEGVPADQRVRIDLSSSREGEWGLLWSQGDAGQWVRGQTLEFQAPGGELWVGAVNLDHPTYARTAALPALRAGQQDITLHISELEPASEDTGSDSAADTGTQESEGGCGGCGGAGGGGLWGLVGLGLLWRRRA